MRSVVQGSRRALTALAVAFVFVAVVGSAGMVRAQPQGFVGPLFGLSSDQSGALLIADAGAGVWRLDGPEISLDLLLAAVSDVQPIGDGDLLVLQGPLGPPEATESGGRVLYRASSGQLQPLADLAVFEFIEDPDGNGFDSNPFDVAAAGEDEFLVVDSGGNTLLRVDGQGEVELVAVFPMQDIPDPSVQGTSSVESVPSSVAVGPDGAYYVGEITGFPGTPGHSRVWRIEPGTTDADCATSEACTVVGTGFTSIMDLAVDGAGTLYVAELDVAGWPAVEGLIGTPSGGAVHACPLVEDGDCTLVGDGLPVLTAITHAGGLLYAVINGLDPTSAQVISIP